MPNTGTKTELAKAFNRLVAIGDLGTQFFWLNRESKHFEYALPVVSGAEFGGDTETIDAPESDSAKVAKVSGRTTLNDITYNSNYTADRYERVLNILDTTDSQTYMEVFSDGSAMMFGGTAGIPTISGEDRKNIEFTIAPQAEQWIKNVFSLTANDVANLQPMMVDNTGADIEITAGESLPFDVDTIPTGRESIVEEKYDSDAEYEEI